MRRRVGVGAFSLMTPTLLPLTIYQQPLASSDENKHRIIGTLNGIRQINEVNKIKMKLLLLLVFLNYIFYTVSAFTTSPRNEAITTTRPVKGPELFLGPSIFADDQEITPKSFVPQRTCVLSLFLTMMLSGLSPVFAGTENDVVLADLPPPYVPVLFGLGLLAGVGLLTSSLGNVLDEEAMLGLQSGAQAKKEIERSRSSYFKK